MRRTRSITWPSPRRESERERKRKRERERPKRWSRPRPHPPTHPPPAAAARLSVSQRPVSQRPIARGPPTTSSSGRATAASPIQCPPQPPARASAPCPCLSTLSVFTPNRTVRRLSRGKSSQPRARRPAQAPVTFRLAPCHPPPHTHTHTGRGTGGARGGLGRRPRIRVASARGRGAAICRGRSGAPPGRLGAGGGGGLGWHAGRRPSQAAAAHRLGVRVCCGGQRNSVRAGGSAGQGLGYFGITSTMLRGMDRT